LRNIKYSLKRIIQSSKTFKALPIYPVRNNAPLLCPVHHAVQGSAGGNLLSEITIFFYNSLYIKLLLEG